MLIAGTAADAVVLLAACAVLASSADASGAHGSGVAITWNREISRHRLRQLRVVPSARRHRVLADDLPRCPAPRERDQRRRARHGGCRPGARSRALASSATTRACPGTNRAVTKWVDGGISRGNNPQMLPKTAGTSRPRRRPTRRCHACHVDGRFTLERPLMLDGLLPEQVPAGHVDANRRGRCPTVRRAAGLAARLRRPLLASLPVPARPYPCRPEPSSGACRADAVIALSAAQ